MYYIHAFQYQIIILSHTVAFCNLKHRNLNATLLKNPLSLNKKQKCFVHR